MIPAILFQNYLKVTKIWCFLLNCTKTFMNCFVSEVSTVGRYQNKICIVLFSASSYQQARRKNRILYVTMEKWKQLHQLALNNISESEGGKVEY